MAQLCLKVLGAAANVALQFHDPQPLARKFLLHEPPLPFSMPAMKRLTAKAKQRAQQLKECNTRRKNRRSALQALNALAEEVQLGARKLPVKSVGQKDEAVEKRIRDLQRRCQEPQLFARLSAAAALWVDNGGATSVPLNRSVVSGSSPASGEEAETLLPEDQTANDADEDEEPVLPQHRQLLPGFVLQSCAFMLTFNSKSILPAMWPPFLAWVKERLLALSDPVTLQGNNTTSMPIFIGLIKWASSAGT